MLPREHGAYGQLLFPIVTAIVMGTLAPAAIALAIAAVAIFLLHEPALVVLGARGERARREGRAVARRWLVRCGAVAVLSGLAAVAALPPAVWWTLVVPAVAALGAVAWTVRGRERTTGGEVAAGMALSSVAFPVGAAAGVSLDAAAACAVAFAVGTTAATLSVRALIGRARGLPHTPSPVAAALGAVALIGVTGVLAIAGAIHPAGFWGAVPLTVAALAIGLVAPPPKFLRRVGWALIAATALTAAVLVIAS